MDTLILHYSSLVFFLVLLKLLDKLWWTPIRIQAMMESQGIKGPKYRFFHGNTKEITKMVKEVMISPMEISHHIFPRIQPHIYTWSKLYGKIFLFWHGPKAQLVVTDPELIKEILINKHEVYPKPARIELTKLVGDSFSISTSTSNKWYKLRKIANHAFHAESLKGMIPSMIASVEMMLDKWKRHEGKVIDVYQDFKVLTSEIISRTAFGSSYLEGEKIFDKLMKIILIISSRSYKIRIPGIEKIFRSSDDTELGELERGIRNSIIKVIKRREVAATMDERASYGNDFLGSLLDAYHDKSKKISLDELIDECKAFYVVGHGTSSSALPWTVLLLAIHRDWQDKARNEVLELFGQKHPNADGISKLKTMSMIINETLRLYSPAVQFARKAVKELKLGEIIVPADMELYLPTYAFHNDPQIWGEDVHLFKPERFAEGLAKATNNNMTAFLPFGLGPRSCVGMSFAITEIKIALSMILQQYKFILSPTYVHSPVQLLTVCPQHGLQVILQPFTTVDVDNDSGLSNAGVTH